MAKKNNTENEELEQETKQEKIKYSKKQLVSSKKYVSNKDLLEVLLEEDKSYTFEEVDSKIQEFKKRKV